MYYNFTQIKNQATSTQLIAIANEQIELINKKLKTSFEKINMSNEYKQPTILIQDIRYSILKESTTIENTLCCIKMMFKENSQLRKENNCFETLQKIIDSIYGKDTHYDDAYKSL